MFYMSAVLGTMLATSGIEPADLERAVAARIRRRMPHMCEVDDLPRILARSTGAMVTKLKRKNRYVLLQLNHRGLYYSEGNATDCWLMAPGVLPDAAMVAAQGRRLDEVVELGSLSTSLGACEISAVEPGWGGGTRFILKPLWIGHQRPAPPNLADEPMQLDRPAG